MTGGRTRPYHSKAEPKPASRAPDPPPWLQGPALAAWNSVVAELVELGCVTRLDGPLLAAWASATGRAVEAELMLNELGGRDRLLVETAHGCARINPLIRIVNDSQRAATHYVSASRRAGAHHWQRRSRRDERMSSRNSLADLEAQAEQRRAEVVEALLALCADAIRNGADPKQVREFADQELDRMADRRQR